MGAIGKHVDEVHGELFRIVMNHNQIAEAADQFLLIGFDLHLRRLLLSHFPSVGLRFKLTQML